MSIAHFYINLLSSEGKYSSARKPTTRQWNTPKILMMTIRKITHIHIQPTPILRPRKASIDEQVRIVFTQFAHPGSFVIDDKIAIRIPEIAGVTTLALGKGCRNSQSKVA